MESITSFVKDLNSQQREAVEHVGSPLLILAGPGSGKTRVITYKIAWLIKEFGIRPQSILAMTFTNKAKKEMHNRVKNLTQFSQYDTPFISTFHSFGASLLRQFSQFLHLEKNFQIYDSSDQIALLKEAMPSHSSGQLSLFMKGISRAKDFGLLPSADEEDIKKFIDIEIYKKYEEIKYKTGNVDFGDLLLLPYQLLKKNKEVKTMIKNRWKWFLIDEYQDTNVIQFLLLQELCGNSENICVVGDDDQSIYKFRGAIVDNILLFENRVSRTKVIKLEQNYRSTPQIISFAKKVIDNNTGRYKKQIFSTLPSGSLPTLIESRSEDDEMSYIGDVVTKTLECKKTCALFFRTNAQSRSYEIMLRKNNIPYIIVGAVGFFARAEVKDILSFVRILKNQNDIISFARVINKPARGIGEKSLEKIVALMKSGKTWMEAIQESVDVLSNKACDGARKFLEIFTSLDMDVKNIGEVCKYIFMKSGLYEIYKEEDKNDGTERVRNVNELISYAFEFKNTDDGWNSFLEQIALAEGAPQEGSVEPALCVQLMTMHRSKGLEFDCVIVCGVEQGSIPMCVDTSFLDEEIEEERRLFYVSITRAKERLYLTYTHMRRRFGKIQFSILSSFLQDVGDDYIHKEYIEYNRSRSYEKNSSHYAIHSADPIRKSKKSEWQVGQRVQHSKYGKGYVRSIDETNTDIVVSIEFDNDYEACFIPRFASGLKKIENY